MPGKRLSQSRLRRRRFREPVANPMDGLQNLADAMLVLAVGVMLALVIHWSIEIDPEQTEQGTREKLEDIEEVESGKEVDLEQLEELGKGVIYIDPDTGEVYLFAEE